MYAVNDVYMPRVHGNLLHICNGLPMSADMYAWHDVYMSEMQNMYTWHGAYMSRCQDIYTSCHVYKNRKTMNEKHPIIERIVITPKPKRPFVRQISVQDVLNYRPDDPSTYISSPLVNAVAEVLYHTKFIDGNDVAHYLELDPRKLSAALSIEVGVTLRDLIEAYRVMQLRAYIAAHPKHTAEELSKAMGYASPTSISRFVRTHLGLTATGKKSYGGTDNWNEMRKSLAKKRR